MTLFVGGPYDGQNLTISDGIEHIRLPAKDTMDAFLQDTLSSRDGMLPHLYSLDKTADPPVFRFVRTLKQDAE